MAQLEMCFEVVIPLGLFTFWQVGWKSCGLGEIGDAFANFILICLLHVFDTILLLQHSFISHVSICMECFGDRLRFSVVSPDFCGPTCGV